MMRPNFPDGPSADSNTDSHVPAKGLLRVADADVLTRRLYFLVFGVVYVIAFVSLWSQIHGLIGQDGLLPAGRFFPAVHQRFGTSAYLLTPSLCWIGSGDVMLHVWCGAGTLLSLCLAIGYAPRPTLFLLWAIYLSLCVAGQNFLSFQWDTLLLEMTLCSWLYAPRGWRPDWRMAPGPLACWPLWGLAFKLMFLSGITKLLSGDSSWSDGTALEFHYYTQPIPSWPAWYAFQWPRGVHQAALAALFAIEVALPFLILAGRRGRAVFGVATMVLMVAIEATGNFGFFNLQTIALALPLLNDRFLKRLIPRRWQRARPAPQIVPVISRWRSIVARLAMTPILAISLLTIVREMSSTARGAKLPLAVKTPIEWADAILLSWGKPWVLEPLAPWRTINGYGLFRVMTTHRHEIVIEISDDGVAWVECEFPYKPGRIDRPPPIVAPHMPRLDWQMWFAALNPRGNQNWLAALVERILEGSPSVGRLLDHPDIKANPPKYVRLAYYEYHFTTAPQRQATGAWWMRTFVGYLTEPITKQQLERSDRSSKN